MLLPSAPSPPHTLCCVIIYTAAACLISGASANRLLQFGFSWSASCYALTMNRIMNAAVRLVADLGVRDHVTPVIRELHWLAVTFRVQYKLYLMVHSSVNGCSQEYITDVLNHIYCNKHTLLISTATFCRSRRFQPPAAPVQ